MEQNLLLLLSPTDAAIDPLSLGMFALRQGAASNSAVLTLGGIRVADTWIPGSGTTTFPLSVSVTDGWNMVSVPGVNPAGQGVSTWWPNRNTTCRCLQMERLIFSCNQHHTG